jgi:hypothetical protein
MRVRARRKDLPALAASAAHRSSCMLLDDAFLYEIRGYMSSQKGRRFIPAVFGNSQVRLAAAYASTSRFLLRWKRPIGKLR